MNTAEEVDSFGIVSLGPPPFLSAFRVPLLKHDSRLGKISPPCIGALSPGLCGAIVLGQKKGGRKTGV
jgi:hypothetical protein